MAVKFLDFQQFWGGRTFYLTHIQAKAKQSLTSSSFEYKVEMSCRHIFISFQGENRWGPDTTLNSDAKQSTLFQNTFLLWWRV